MSRFHAWKNQDGISYEFRKELSQKVFQLMADYNLSISNYMKEISKYWVNEFNWRKHETEINKFSNFTSTVDNIDIQ